MVLGPLCVLSSSRLNHLELAVWIPSPEGESLLGSRLLKKRKWGWSVGNQIAWILASGMTSGKPRSSACILCLEIMTRGGGVVLVRH